MVYHAEYESSGEKSLRQADLLGGLRFDKTHHHYSRHHLYSQGVYERPGRRLDFLILKIKSKTIGRKNSPDVFIPFLIHYSPSDSISSSGLISSGASFSSSSDVIPKVC